ncbi:UDP-GlcNAc--UDP-phosphate GlcNAc-1-phosphate transferase [Mesoflavibacter zeaxanthinifaciens]|uniref:UDP-GlcNAc--UDP-phosphate GlcNAc-1-phosphate transferase n=1 Tax=Mesoflavibacter zeaxanthinifaciens TaxID=393060 RepID=UPI0026EA7403|nr:UDP-GlcNAc--UDP-phosphate GlcNAc-1-phosphate transferase [Mesoflavibacter zeaxanthinifaciens]
MINYILIFLLLFVLEMVYLKIAKIKNIKDNPNHRSAHTTPTIRGGGIIIPMSIILYLLFYNNPTQFLYFFSGVILVAIVSFIDDLIMLSSKTRLLTHLLALVLMFFGLGLFDEISLQNILFLFFLTVFSIGFLNIYNFMDGINGITFLNALASYSTLLYLNNYYQNFTDNYLLVVLILAILVFGFFNFRKKAICFAGDIGSITIGFSLLYFVLQLYLKTENHLVFLIFGTYLLDGGWTIIERIYRKENIFEAHKRHLYQLLVNDLKIPHLLVSSYYFFIQLLISIILIYLIKLETYSIIGVLSVFIFLSLAYLVTKVKIIKKITKT